MKTDFIIIVILFAFILSLQGVHYINNNGQLAGVFFTPSITEVEITDIYNRAQFNPRKIRILIVPGHDNDSWGTEYKGLPESDINLELGKKLFEIFSKDPYFTTILARSDEGYIDPLAQTFLDKEAVITFRETYKNYTKSFIDAGLVSAHNGVSHNFASSDVSIKLFGINKWANENDIDIVLHVHFNDHPGRRYNQPGKYTGLAIYIPEKQYSNSHVSQRISEYVYKSLDTLFPTSDHIQEKAGVIEDQELIAIGSYNSLDSASLLIEYGYIYETQVINNSVRGVALNEYVNKTYIGIKNYFESRLGRAQLKSDPLKQFFLNFNLSTSPTPKRDVFILQTILQHNGVYPPDGYTKNNCPPTGIFGPCTKKSVIEFQKKYNIYPREGFVGPQTRGKINEIISTLDNP